MIDTGSIDRTRELVAEEFGLGGLPERLGFKYDGAPNVIQEEPVLKRVVFDTFEWVDDFSAARQFSFELGAARWRGYLDDDDLGDELRTKGFREMVARTERDHPESNCISLKYEYVPDKAPQDKIRFVRWDTGWRWEDPVHEHLVPIGHPRAVSKYEDVWIRHCPIDPQGHANAAFERNGAILERAYANEMRPEKKALWAYYLGIHLVQLEANVRGHAVVSPEAKKRLLDDARRAFREAADGLGMNNLACDALVRWARLEGEHGNTDRAIELAAEAIGKAPELPDGLAALGVAQIEAGNDVRAAAVFDMLRAQPTPAFESQHDAVFLDGIAKCRAALAYYRAGRIDDAARTLGEIPEGLRRDPEIRAAARDVVIPLQRTEGYKRLHALWEYFIWSAEPLRAKQLLEEFVPRAISDQPQAHALLRSMRRKLQHMEDWNAYRRAYAAIPDLPYHVPEGDRDWTLTQARSRMVMRWAKQQGAEGRPLEVLTIGVQDGIIEAGMMELCPRIQLTVCDVAPQASKGIAWLMEKFPGRVKTHAVELHHCDWFAADAPLYDAVLLFEVLEHLPNDEQAIGEIRAHLQPTGQLFLSTPVAAHWVESYLADMTSDRPWWHVRAHNPTSLWALVQKFGLTGTLLGVSEENLFLGTFQPRGVPKWSATSARELPSVDPIAIYVYPMRPLAEGFDPFSPKLEHVGGSEEAVIHLSAALARKGVPVTVYTDMPQRKDQLFVYNGVQWRPHAEFDPESMKGTVLVWRSPRHAVEIKKRNPRLRVLNWLHDALSQVGSDVYNAVDGTIVLSQFHAQAIAKYDGYAGPFLFAANGIVPEEFPQPDESKRNPLACIYAAAPNRGLEHLLDAWPLVHAKVPGASLDVYYSWELTEKMARRQLESGDKSQAAAAKETQALLRRLREKLETLKDAGVVYHGGVSHAQLHDAYRRAGIWSYPPVAFDEIYCISALKAQASGCWPVIVPTGSLPETCPNGAHVRSHDVRDYANALVEWMRNPPTPEQRNAIRAWPLSHCTWDDAADQFIVASTAKNRRITIFAGAFGRRFDGCGSADGKPLGGSEEAVIAMAFELATRGEQVFVYCPLPEGGARPEGSGVWADGTRVRWLDSSTFDPAGPHGTLLAWRCPHLLSKLKGNGYPVVLWLMDPEYNNMGARGFDYEEADAVTFLTESHRDIIRRRDGYVGQRRNLVFRELAPSGSGEMSVVRPYFDQTRDAIVHVGLPALPVLGSIAREPRWVMWATSPDRGLLEFLRLWRTAITHVTDAQLHIFYGLEPLERAGKGELAAAIRQEIADINAHPSIPNAVVYHGGVSDEELVEWYQRCSLFVYRSLHFEETQSISTCKAQALGCWPLVNNAGALFEVTRLGDTVPLGAGGSAVHWPYGDHEFGPYLVDMLKSPPTEARRLEMARAARNYFSRERMGTLMLQVIEAVRR